MSKEDRDLLVKGLEKAEYNTLRMKSMRNEMVVRCDEDGNISYIPAREVFTQMYHQAAPVY